MEISEESNKFSKFEITKGEPKTLMGQKSFNNVTYAIHKIPKSALSV
jgi:hypothetical protein